MRVMIGAADASMIVRSLGSIESTWWIFLGRFKEAGVDLS